jgi:hypothetical protein
MLWLADAGPTLVHPLPGCSADEVCTTSSAACQKWTALPVKCEENLCAWDSGDMSHQRPYCTQSEQLREPITGVADSSAPGAYAF